MNTLSLQNLLQIQGGVNDTHNLEINLTTEHHVPMLLSSIITFSMSGISDILGYHRISTYFFCIGLTQIFIGAMLTASEIEFQSFHAHSHLRSVPHD